MKCRFCDNILGQVFANLGMSPLANSYLTSDHLNQIEHYYPLITYVCDKCFLVQLDEFEKPQHIFSNYAYFSSYSKTWLKHAKDYVEKTICKFGLNQNSLVIEIASNDGYLLQNFKNSGIPILGIEPAANVAKIAIDSGIPTVVKFFGSETARELVRDNKQADLLIAVNVIPHTPNLNDFVESMKILLKPRGIITIQFSAYLLPLIKQSEFDMIYHEHFSYFSLWTLQKVLSNHDLTIFHVEELSVHGGSLRLYVKHTQNDSATIDDSVNHLLEKERKFGLTSLSTYQNFQEQIVKTKMNIWNFLITSKKSGKKIVGYGAPAKGNTLLNYCGIGLDFIDYTVDINIHKQGRYLPGTHIPIYEPAKVRETKPDYLLILAWNLKEEVMEQMNYIREWGGKFVVLIPEVQIYS